MCFPQSREIKKEIGNAELVEREVMMTIETVIVVHGSGHEDIRIVSRSFRRSTQTDHVVALA